MNTRVVLLFVVVLLFFFVPSSANGQSTKPLRLGVAGVSHGHLHEVIVRMDRGDFEVVGVAEPDAQLRESNGLWKKLDASLFYADLEEMLDKTKPEAVIAYGSIFDHLQVVEACAPRGIHVMVEKPLPAWLIWPVETTFSCSPTTKLPGITPIMKPTGL